MEGKEQINLIGHCGHHCAFCIGRDKCGGCRSENNICSFATLFPDGICPNSKCVFNKGIAGCYDCNELTECNIGYYGRENEYTAKATAIFIHKYGEKYYTEALEKAILAGEEYPKSFDICGSVKAALLNLEKYLSQ